MVAQSVSSRENVLIEPRRLSALLRRPADIVAEWRRRVVWRRELENLSYLDLRDLGFPDGIEAEKAKPFWRA